MKKNKITFFAMELILLVLALFFVWKIFIQNVPEKRVAVILPESGDQRWDSLIKGMKQSAKENHIHLVICNTDDIENAEAEKEAIEEQKNNHIDAFIVLPAPGIDTEEMLTKECSDVPVILAVEDLYTEDAEATSKFSVVAPDYYEMGKYIGGQINSRKQTIGIVVGRKDIGSGSQCSPRAYGCTGRFRLSDSMALLSGKRPGCLRESERTAKSRYAGSVRSRCIRSTGRPV